LIANGGISRQSVRAEAATWGTANREGELSARHAPTQSDRTIVPPDAVGWMVRVTTPPATEEFWLAAYPDKGDAEAAVKEHVKASANEELEGVATLSPEELAAQHMNPGDIKHG
jgi:hypothetical protein